jgi:hypothetical protein
MSAKDFNTIEDVSLLELPMFAEPNGALVVMEEGDGTGSIPFKISRTFVVSANCGAVRGNHAHFQCYQFMQSNNGNILVSCNDGNNSVDYELDRPNIGLLVPPGIWATQIYKDSNAFLVVLCDQRYTESDYLRDYEVYLEYRANFI